MELLTGEDNPDCFNMTSTQSLETFFVLTWWSPSGRRGVPVGKVCKVGGSSEAVQGILYNTGWFSGLPGCSGLGLSSGKEPSQHWRQNSSQDPGELLSWAEGNSPPLEFWDHMHGKETLWGVLGIAHRKTVHSCLLLPADIWQHYKSVHITCTEVY